MMYAFLFSRSRIAKREAISHSCLTNVCTSGNIPSSAFQAAMRGEKASFAAVRPLCVRLKKHHVCCRRDQTKNGYCGPGFADCETAQIGSFVRGLVPLSRQYADTRILCLSRNANVA